MDTSLCDYLKGHNTQSAKEVLDCDYLKGHTTQSAKEVLEETKVLKSKLSKKERCRNLEFYMMSSCKTNEIKADEEDKRDYLQQFKNQKQKGTLLQDVFVKERDIIPAELDKLNRRATENRSYNKLDNVDRSRVVEYEQHNYYQEASAFGRKSFSLIKKSDSPENKRDSPENKRDSDDKKYSYPFHIDKSKSILDKTTYERFEDYLSNYTRDQNSKFYPRVHNSKVSRDHYQHKYSFPPTESPRHHDYMEHEQNFHPMYRPVYFFPEYYMYDNTNPNHQRPKHETKSPRESFIEKENCRIIGADDLDDTRVTMKNKKTGYLCHQCGKVYCRKYVLKIHQRVHSGEKPLECHVCGKCFSDPSNLKKHIKLHEPDQSLHTCHLCARQFSRKRSLTHHIHTSHQNGNVTSANIDGTSTPNSPHDSSSSSPANISEM